jgi:ribosomal-protein-alanine N-acetyltransferase
MLPPLSGERVLLRAPQAGDEAALVEMATDARVRAYVGGPVHRSIAIANATEKVNNPAWGQFVITDLTTGVVIGSGDLARKRGPWEVSYQLRHAYWGNGLGSEAVTLICAWFFAHTDDDLLIAVTQQANVRSRRLLTRVGAVAAGSFEAYGRIQERYEFRRSWAATIGR